MTSLHSKILCDVQEMDFGMGIFIKFLPRTSFFLKISTQGLSALLATSQVSFSTRARFLSSVFLRPRPPAAFGVHIESQLFKQTPFFFFLLQIPTRIYGLAHKVWNKPAWIREGMKLDKSGLRQPLKKSELLSQLGLEFSSPTLVVFASPSQ